MYFKILKKDLKRKKSMNLILLVFILLATTFIAGSVNNLLVVMNGTDSFLKLAGVADYVFITMEAEQEDPYGERDRVEHFLEETESVTDYRVDDLLYATNGQVSLKGGEQAVSNNTILINRIHIGQQKFFDENDQVIEDVGDGTIYLKRKTMIENELEPGDMLYIDTENGYHKEFRIMGYCKDAFSGSDMMGAERYIVSDADFEELKKEAGLPHGRLYSVESDDLEQFEKDYNKEGFSVITSADQKLIKTTYIMDMVTAAILLMVSICLVLISVVMLRFTILFTISEDFREIGIMKAIGIRNGFIRRLYLFKYFLIAVCGAVIGFALSIPFSRISLQNVARTMVMTGTGGGILLQLGMSVLVVGVVVLFGYAGTAKIKTLTPMDAIRSGNSGERFRKKGVLRLAESRWKPTTFLAGNDVLSELKKYLVLLVTSAIGVWLVIMPVNTINTLSSEKIAAWFGVTDCDFFIAGDGRTAALILSGDRQAYYDYLDEIREQIEDEGIAVSKVVMEVFLNLKVRSEEDSYSVFCLQGFGTTTDRYFYDRGTAPVYENEVAVTHITAGKLHADIGDTIYITSGGEEKPYIITAIFQSMNDMGEGIRFSEKADLDYSAVSGCVATQVILKEKPDEKTLLETIETVQKIMPDTSVKTVTEYIDSVVGGFSKQLHSMKVVLLIIVILINILVVVLMQKMFLIREQGEMGMMKAIGFSNGSIISWQTKRIAIVLFAGILLGTLTGTPFSQITSGQVFKIMGASRITFVINPVEVYGIYPAALFVATVLACVFTMRKVRKISAQEMNQIE